MPRRRYRNTAAHEDEDDLATPETDEAGADAPQEDAPQATGGTFFVPTHLERFLGIEGEQVTCASLEAAQGWDETLWRRGPLPW